MKRPVGAPTSIDAIVAETPEGVPITAAERIISTLETGEYVHAAAQAALITVTTYYEWVNEGAAAHKKHAEGQRLTANEKRYAQFASDVAAAQAEGRARILGAIHGAAVGGAIRRTTITKTIGQGEGLDPVVEITTKEETLAPDVQAATWMAERKWPKDWGRRTQVEITGEDGGPIRIVSPLAEMVAITDQMDRRASALEASARELAPQPPPVEPSSPAAGDVLTDIDAAIREGETDGTTDDTED